MANINTLAENMQLLTGSVNDAMSMITGYTEANTSIDSSVIVTTEDGQKIYMPSYTNVIKRLERAENTVASFVEGRGVVETDDDTYRKIKVDNIAKSPYTIDSAKINSVKTFHTNSNWYFEDFLFPKCVVRIDLKGLIDDDSDRVYVKRVILDYTKSYNGTNVKNYYQDEIQNSNLTYPALIQKLENDEIKYYEDDEEIKLPLTYEKYKGTFNITKIETEQDFNGVSRLYYYLDTIYYRQVDENGATISNAYQLSKGDYIRFNDSLYKITSIDTNANKITIDYYVGYETPAINAAFEFYVTPFAEKNAEIGIGFNEVNIIYIKGVNENFNIMSSEWSNPIIFLTNDLTYESSKTTLAEYYPNYVMDIGAEWVAKAKQSNIMAYNGTIPNTPVLSANDMQVVQINTQLEATLDTDEYNNLVSSIRTTKSNIDSLKTNITQNKEALIQSTDDTTIQTLENSISADTDSLSTYTTQYNTLVEELNTLLNENGALSYSPKYHVRGFFPIPDPVYSNAELGTGKQEVIGFDIMYRYIHTDDTGVELNTYSYSNKGVSSSAVFSDWNIVTSRIKEQIFDENIGAYKWESDDEADGTVININQIDIPIRSGEKVEIKVRSISEAGYPSNPLKSDWSNTITISFPSNLSSNDAITNIIDSAKDDMSAVVMQQTMSAAGLYTHIADATSQYKHNAENIYITYTDTDASKGKITTNLASFLQDMYNKVYSTESNTNS